MISRFRRRVYPSRSSSSDNSPKIFEFFTRLSATLLPNTVPTLFVPPVPELLHCNDSPTDLEEHLICLSLSQAKAERDRLAQQIRGRELAVNGARQQSIAKLRFKEAQVAKFIRDHEGLVSVLRRMPVEVMYHIFIYVALDFSDSRGDATNSITSKYHPFLHGPDSPRILDARNPVVLSLIRVCRFWKDIALTCPFLWTRFPLVQVCESEAITQQQVGLLSKFVERSKGLPIDICVSSTESLSSQSPVVELLLQHCNRWEVLTINGHFRLFEMFQGIKEELSHFKTLTVNSTDSFRVEPAFFAPFATAPKLEEINIDGFWILTVIAAFIPIHRLIRYSSIRFSPVAQYLQSLSLTDLSSGMETEDSGPFILPCLVSLDLEWKLLPEPQYNMCFRSTTEFLQLATLPVIEDIRIMTRHEGRYILRDLKAMLSRSPYPSTLRRLYFHTSSTGMLNNDDLFELAPLLTELNTSLPQPDIIRELARGRVSGTQSVLLLPLLQSCTFEIRDSLPERTVKAIVSLIDERGKLGLARRAPSSAASPILKTLRIGMDLGMTDAGHRLHVFHAIQTTAVRLWETDHEYSLRDSYLLHDETARLLGALYDFPGWRKAASAQVEAASKKDLAAVVKILFDIENLRLGTRHIRGIFSSNINVLLYDLAHYWSIHDIPVRETCWRILAKWKTLVEAHLRNINFRWVFDRQTREGGLYYIHQNHPCRENLHRFSETLIYGLGGKPE